MYLLNSDRPWVEGCMVSPDSEYGGKLIVALSSLHEQVVPGALLVVGVLGSPAVRCGIQDC